MGIPICLTRSVKNPHQGQINMNCMFISTRFLKTPHQIIYSCMYSYLFDSFSEKPLSKAKYIYKLIRLNSIFGSMVNVPLFENQLHIYLLVFM